MHNYTHMVLIMCHNGQKKDMLIGDVKLLHLVI